MSNLGKKVFFALLSVVSIISISQTFAADQDSNNILNALQGDSATWTSSITTTGATSTTVGIQFPIFSSNGEQIMNYAISYVKGKSIAGADLSDIKKVTFEGNKVQISSGQVTLILDGLTPSSTYNFVVSPINKEGTELELSDEFSLQTTASDGNTTTTTTPTGTQTAINGTNETMMGAADTASANFTYVLDGSKVTVNWKTITGASKFDFSMKETTATTYTYLGSADITKDSYSFVIGKKGLFTVKIVPVDATGKTVGVERTLSIKISAVTPPSGTGTPATGAGLNLILMSTFLMMLIYVVYRFRTTK